MKKRNTQKQPQNLSAKESTMKLLKEAGIEVVQKTGAILMPLSKEQRESIKK